MIIYLDVLIIVNTIVDYFLLLLTARINKITYKSLRIILGAFLGGLSSMYIFLPRQSFIIEIGYRVLTAALICIAAFTSRKIKIILRNTAVFLVSSFIYCGVIMAIWLIFKPNSIVINNSYVYYDISATYLIIFSVVLYIAITVIMSLLKKEAVTAKRCSLEFRLGDTRLKVIGILDTGNSVTDIFTDSPVFFVSEEVFKKLFGSQFAAASAAAPDRYRILPCETVNKGGMLEGLRCDAVTVELENKSGVFKNPVLIFSNNKFSDDYDAIVNPEILLRME